MEFPKTLITKILNRFPSPGYLAPVYGLIVMLVYGWSFYQFIWNLPSWMKFLTVSEIGILLAYTLTMNAIESILILSVPTFISVVLPAKWFHDDFVIRGGLSVLYVLFFAMFASHNAISFSEINKFILRGVVDLAFLHFVIGYVHPLRSFIKSLAERSTTFLYFSVPSSVIAGIIILIQELRSVI
jgi:hypothetical protein